MQTQPTEIIERAAQAMRGIPLPDAAYLNESEWRMLARAALRAALPWPAFSGDVDALMHELYPEKF